MGTVERALAIAGINATVLSILGAVAAVYAGRIFEKLDEFQAAVLISANRINALPSPGGSLGGPIFEKYLSPQETRSPDEVADEIAERALKMMMGLLGDWPDEPAQRGEQLSQTLTLVVMRYPFPTVIEVQPQGEIAMLAVPRPVPLRTGKQVRDWVGTLRSITGRLLWAWEGNQGKVQEMFSAIGGTQDEFMRTLDQQSARLADSLSPGALQDYMRHIERAKSLQRDIGHALIQVIQLAHGIGRDVTMRLEELDLYRASHPRRRLLAAAIAFSVVMFVIGVVLPMAWPSVPIGVVIWPPVAFYTLVFGFVVFRLARV